VKNKKYLIILFITILAYPAKADEPVFFADENLKAAVEETLGVTNPTPTNMLRLNELSAYSKNISSLTGLEYAANLTELVLADNQISDISVLFRLTNLVTLKLQSNQISDVSMLANMKNLYILNLNVNRISDISGLVGLSNLWALHLYGNQISDISVLAGLTNLGSLGLANNQISDISALAGLKNMWSLQLDGNQISDISALAELTNLETLYLGDNQVSDISALSGLTNLERVVLPNNKISEISALADKKKLNYLDLLDNPLNYDACYIYIPLIIENNPDIDIRYNPYIQNKVYVDDNGPNDSVPYDSTYSDPSEDGTYEHPFDTIQEGINIAISGELVIVREGTYRETIEFVGKKITVTSFDPEEPNVIRPYPILDAGYNGTAVIFKNEEGPNCTLEGFVITHGMGDMSGAIRCLGSSPTISNCLIVGNRATNPDGGGGAVFCTDSNAIFENCTFSGNYGGPQGASLLIYNSNVTIVNSILWDNYIEISVASGSLPSINYCDIQSEWQETGNITELPLFAQPGYWAASDTPDLQISPSDPNAVWIDGDYHLHSEFGRYKGRYGWVRDEVTSGCIDFGHPSTSLGQEPSPNGGVINIGAYGATSQASKSSPIQEPIYFADANLKAAVELILDVNDPTPTNMLDLTALDSRIRGWRVAEISDLSGLQYAKNLSQLWLDYNQISDISPLAGLTNLEQLSLEYNQIADISALNNKINLQFLDLRGNPLNQQAYDVHIPQIIENNLNITINYDPCSN
jgi:Leucine-rich repeat (LRR) protein